MEAPPTLAPLMDSEVHDAAPALETANTSVAVLLLARIGVVVVVGLFAVTGPVAVVLLTVSV